MYLKPLALFVLLLVSLSSSLMADDSGKYDKETIISEAEGYLGAGAEGLASVIEKAFEDHGQPDGYVKGREASGALVVGLRYGDGDIYLKNGYSRQVHWQGPSVGFDWGGNAAKVFMLVYDLPSVESVFQRYPGVDGSLYFIGGAGLNYVQRDETVIAPIRLGVGWRAGASVGYLKFTPEKTWNPL